MGVDKVLILGGYGNFGQRIARKLSSQKDITIIIAGRDADKAQQLCLELSKTAQGATYQSAVLDINRSNFKEQLRKLSPDLTIHTSGPFQNQDYRVPQACISVASHYIDLADDRRFVCDISSLDKQATEKNVLVISGASSVPGLSSTVIDHFCKQFSSLDEIDFAIAPGNQAERGEATVRAMLSQAGRSFQVLKNSEWIDQYGWMSPRSLGLGGVIGKRWLANVDIPDLELFPARYQSTGTVNFQAGLELTTLHFGMVLMAYATRTGLIKDWSKFTRQLIWGSELFIKMGTGVGGMQINLTGTDKNHQPKKLRWTLTAENGVGPYIPTISAVILAKKLIAGTISISGASPCLGLYTLKEFDTEATPMGIYHQVQTDVG